MNAWKIGVDGGATKTECVLLDAAGRIANRHTAPGCNPSLVGHERAPVILRDALQALMAGRTGDPISRTLLCLAGSRSFWKEAASLLEGFGVVETAPDSLPVLELATHGRAGLALHAGTGSFLAARAADGSLHYAGGLGWRFGDAGSGYDVGRRGIARALLELQGWAEPSRLATTLCRHTGLTDYIANSRHFHLAPDAHASIAAFAPRVVELAGQGDRAAQRIIVESMAEMAEWVDAMLQRLFPRATAGALIPCGVSGPLLNQPPCLEALQALAATRAWPVHLQPIVEAPIEGVRRLLLASG